MAVDPAVPMDPAALRLVIRDQRRWSRTYVYPWLRVGSRVLVTLIVCGKRACPVRFAAHGVMDRLCLWFLRRFVSQDAVSLLVRHFIVETNLLGPMLLCRRIVGRLRAERKPGDIVFISSDATQHKRPSLATYLSTKAGLEAFAQTLALESEGVGVRSSVVRVGPTLTGFADDWDLTIFEELMPRWQRFGIQRHWNVMQPDDVARAVVTVVTAPAHMWVPIVEVQPNPPVEPATCSRPVPPGRRPRP